MNKDKNKSPAQQGIDWSILKLYFFSCIPFFSSKSTAARLQKAIATDKQLASVAEQIKKQEPLENGHTKHFWHQYNKMELIEQLQLYEKLVNYASNRFFRLSKEAIIREKKDS